MAMVRTALVIEDSRTMRTLACQVLKQHGYKTLEAENGQTGLEIALDKHPDLILCDIHMPVVDGYGFVAQARQQDDLHAVPILMLTARTDRESLRRAMSSGADDYLTKPFTPEELLVAVRGLEHKRTRQELTTQKSMNQLRGAILATVPHELRTPLTTILGMSQLLVHRRKNYNEARLDDMLGSIHDAASRLSRTITRMMEWSELTAQGACGPSGTPTHHGVTDLAELQQRLESSDFLTELRTAMPPSGVADEGELVGGHPVRVKLAPGRVQVEAQDLRRMVIELVSNAAKFSMPGTPVGLTGKVLNGTHYAIEVANLGPALPPEFLRQIGALSQVNRDRHEQQGTGLGLSMVTLWARRNGAQLQWPRSDGQPTIARLLLKLA
ncbi:MAG: hypothetical protein CFE46_06795 [Burkholderiales bacterium PBB6]|nr:MAG: hypothetical protein CFE46_06795 [Burkholderiales bacterium PBB6]